MLWLGPDEWLLLASDGSGAEWEGHLRTAVTDAFVTIVDVSKARLGFELVGIGARKLLEIRLRRRPAPAGLRAGLLRADTARTRPGAAVADLARASLPGPGPLVAGAVPQILVHGRDGRLMRSGYR